VVLPPEPGKRGLRILLVEDNEDSRITLRKLLEMQGHVVEDAGEGSSGVTKALAWKPDVALIDIGLPGLDGFEVARAVRSAAAGARLHLIALTGYGDPGDRRRALEAGFDAHLVKPVRLEALTRLLAAARNSGPCTP
jgi:CheY-like chemotaxis protein